MNRSEIWSAIKMELLGLKWVGNTTRQLTHPHSHFKREPQAGRELFGVYLLILHFKSVQFSKSIKSSTFQYFSQFNLSFQKTIYLSQNAQKSPKNLRETAKQCMVNEISKGIWRCLKLDRDIGKKAMLSDVKTAFTCTPAFMTWTHPQLKFPYNKYLVDKFWTKIYCQIYFRGITLTSKHSKTSFTPIKLSSQGYFIS